MNTEINHTSARFNLWRRAGPVESQTPAVRRVKRSRAGGGKFSLGSLQAAAMSEFITELAVRKKRDGESWSRGGGR